jgi:hypothetical protein
VQLLQASTADPLLSSSTCSRILSTYLKRPASRTVTEQKFTLAPRCPKPSMLFELI